MASHRTTMSLAHCPDCGALRQDAHERFCVRYKPPRAERGLPEGLALDFTPVYGVWIAGPLLTLAPLARKP